MDTVASTVADIFEKHGSGVSVARPWTPNVKYGEIVHKSNNFDGLYIIEFEAFKEEFKGDRRDAICLIQSDMPMVLWVPEVVEKKRYLTEREAYSPVCLVGDKYYTPDIIFFDRTSALQYVSYFDNCDTVGVKEFMVKVYDENNG